jgi:hypothetical protein
VFKIAIEKKEWYKEKRREMEIKGVYMLKSCFLDPPFYKTLDLVS